MIITFPLKTVPVSTNANATVRLVRATAIARGSDEIEA